MARTRSSRSLGNAGMELSTHSSIRDLGEAAYRRLLPADAPPFVLFAWLDALEQAGCVVPERGWMPVHVAFRDNGELVAAAPAYVKGNSEGEFVFDHAWARFAYGKLGVEYYPKLLFAVPFTPATGPRLFVAPGADVERVVSAFATGVRALCGELGLSSAHVLFPNADLADGLEERGFVRRAGVQYHWTNAGYATFDDFLGGFGAKRRHQIRRERRELERGGTRIEHLTGADLSEEVLDHMYDFYCSTVHKYFWGRQYLNRRFFEAVFSRMPERLHVVLARDTATGEPVGGALNLVGQNALYGRYWGAREERPFLHFGVCYYEGIDACIRRGLSSFEPGAGGEHKRARGFSPAVTHSVHHLHDRRLDATIRDYCEREREAIEEYVRS